MKQIWIVLGTLLFAFGNGSAQTDTVPPPPRPDTSAVAGPVGSSSNVKRATFATGVVEREPVDQVESIGTSFDKAYFFTEITGFEGGSITHRWSFGGETMAEVNFNIGGPRWRVYSIKTLDPTQTGAWTVDVLDGQGNVIQTKTLTYKVEAESPRSSAVPDTTAPDTLR